MTENLHRPVLMAARDLPSPVEGAAPEWIHLLPAGEILTNDGRGPFRLPDPGRVVQNSFRTADRLPIDENHATDLAAPKGAPAPARGWIVALEAREDGIWGRVEWTEEGRRLVEGRAYRGISPAILHTRDEPHDVLAILRASLVNNPNLRGLTALHSEEDTEMLLSERLVELLGLNAGAGDDEIVTALQSALASWGDDTAHDLQSQMGEVAVALGLGADAAPEAVLNAAKATAGGDGESVVALQAVVAELTTRINDLTESGARERAEAFVDAEIARGNIAAKHMRGRFVDLHMENPAETEAELRGMPALKAGALLPAVPPAAAQGGISLNAEQAQAAKLQGLSAEEYAKTLEAERNKETI